MAMYAQSSNQSQSTGNLLSQKPSSHRSNYHPSSGAVSSKKYNAFFSDEDSPRSYRTKHYSDDEDSYSDDDSYDYSRSAARQREANYSSRKSSGLRQSSANKNGMIPPPRPRSKNPFADAITMDEPSSRPKGSSRSHRRRSDSYSSYSSDSSKSFSDDDEYPSRSVQTKRLFSFQD